VKIVQEASDAHSVAKVFSKSADFVEHKLESVPRYVRGQWLKRFLAMYEIYKWILPVRDGIVECGEFQGFGFPSLVKLSAIL